MSRTLRRAIAPAAVIIGLLAVPSAAFALPANLSIDSVDLVGTPAAGDIAQYDVTLIADDATATNDAHLVLNADVVGTTTITGGATLGASSCTGATCDFATGADASGSDIVVHYHVQLPKYYVSSFDVTAELSGVETDDSSLTSTPIVVSKGGPSELSVTFGPMTPSSGLLDKWVTKGGEVTSVMTVKNNGVGAAYFADVQVEADGQASVFSPSWAPNPAFNPTATIIASAACTNVAADTCEIATLAPGASVAIPVKLSALTHYGWVSFDAFLGAKADNGPDDGSDGSASIQITDGTTVEPHVAVNVASRLAAGNTNVTFNGEAANNGPNAITNGVLYIDANSFDTAGEYYFGSGYTTDTSFVPSIQSITVSTGATCARVVEHFAGSPEPVYADNYACPVASLAAGARLTFTVTAKFATTKERTGNVSAWLASSGYTADGSIDGGASVNLNRTKYADLEVSVTSAALIGADRATVQTVTITNKGTDKSTFVSLDGAINSTAGTFDGDLLPANCTGVTKPQFAKCNFGTIEAGASKTIAMPLHAGAKLGSMASTYTVNGSGDINPDNDSITQVVTIVKANAVPLLGVIVAKAPAQAMAKVAKTGVKTVVTVPGPTTVKVDLIVTAKVAQTLGLVKAPKKSTKKAKKAPAFYTIGTSTTKVAAAGKVTTTTKLTKKYVKKLLAAKKKFAVKRTVTVVSTAPKTAGASSMTSQTLTFTPAKAKKGKK